MVKRIFDVFFSVIGLIFVLPVLLVVKICYVFSGDFYPIIYKSERVGKGGKLFDMYKIRTMNPDKDLGDLSEEQTEELLSKNKLTDDPRVTPAGRFLRKTSIDELPQLLNVLKNDMSMIGPRPLVPGELEHYGGDDKYNSIKPGITGWWACNGRSDLDYKKRLELEYYYIDNVSALLDFKCLCKTIVSVIKREGAV